jgi:hypothetical protein
MSNGGENMDNHEEHNQNDENKKKINEINKNKEPEINPENASPVENLDDEMPSGSSEGPNHEGLKKRDNYVPEKLNNHVGGRQFAKTLHDKDYYKKKGDELRKREQDLREEKARDFKNVPSKNKKEENDDPEKKNDGTNNKKDNKKPEETVKPKNKIDKLKDNNALIKNKLDTLGNKKDEALSKAYQTAHPIEATNAKIKASIVLYLKTHPIVLIILFFMLFIFLCVCFIMFSKDDNDYDNINSSNSYSDSCGAMSLNSTTLGRSQFISLLKSYADKASHNKDGWKMFSNNADTIYDIATSNNINPELVVSRAMAEGFSPGTGYNYWGIAVYNGKSTGASYSSFSKGVEGFIKAVSKYPNITAMASKYAYIGSHWFNPGGSGSGGCYYFPYIKQYMSVSRASVVESACSSNKVCSGSSCIATNAEDQKAYATWQVSKMTDNRKYVFNLLPDSCDEYSSSCTLYAQGDSRWKDTRLGGSGPTMHQAGCAVTSIAIGISCSGTKVNSSSFDAGKLVDKLNSGNCFASGGGIKWGCSAIQELAPNVKFVGTVNFGSSAQLKLQTIGEYDKTKYFIILHIHNAKHSSHYVVYQSVEGNHFIVKDPAGGKIAKYDIADIDGIKIYSY